MLMTPAIEAIGTGVDLCAAAAIALVALLTAAGDLRALLGTPGDPGAAPIVLLAEIHSCRSRGETAHLTTVCARRASDGGVGRPGIRGAGAYMGPDIPEPSLPVPSGLCASFCKHWYLHRYPHRAGSMTWVYLWALCHIPPASTLVVVLMLGQLYVCVCLHVCTPRISTLLSTS